MFCEYCRPRVSNELLFRKDLPSLSIDNLHLQLFIDSKDHDLKVILRDDDRGADYSFIIGDVNYCMMCGRELSNDTKKGDEQ